MSIFKKRLSSFIYNLNSDLLFCKLHSKRSDLSFHLLSQDPYKNFFSKHMGIRFNFLHVILILILWASAWPIFPRFYPEVFFRYRRRFLRNICSCLFSSLRIVCRGCGLITQFLHTKSKNRNFVTGIQCRIVCKW